MINLIIPLTNDQYLAAAKLLAQHFDKKVPHVEKPSAQVKRVERLVKALILEVTAQEARQLADAVLTQLDAAPVASAPSVPADPNIITPPPELRQEHLEYLDGLRTSGVTNMFGARPYLIAEFDLTPETAGAVLVYWMKTFGIRHLAANVPSEAEVSHER